MKIIPNEKYQLRDGTQVRVVCVDVKGPFPVLILIDKGDHEEAEFRLADGRCHATSNGPYDVIGGK